jgi:hypothetical protein
MRQSLVRSISVLMLVLALALGTMAAPAFAGFASGAGDILAQSLIGQPVGTCAYVQDLDSTHFFIGVVTGNAGLKVIGPLSAPFVNPQLETGVATLSHCAFLGGFSEPQP